MFTVRIGAFGVIILSLSLLVTTECAAVKTTGEAIDIEIFPGTVEQLSVEIEAADKVKRAYYKTESFVIAPEAPEGCKEEGSWFDVGIAPINETQLDVSIEATSARCPGTYTGFLRTTPRNLVNVEYPITINVVAPSADVIPPDISDPSRDRIITDPRGVKLVKDEVLLDLPYTLSLAEAERRATEVALATGGVFVGSIPGLRIYQLRYQVDSYAELNEVRQQIRDAYQYPDTPNVGLNYLGEPQLAPNDQELVTNTLDAFDLISAPQAWDLTTGSDDPRASIGIIDNGFVPDHQDFRTDINNAATTKAEIFAGGTGAGFHGTWVAGVAGAIGNNVVGVAGISWGAKLRFYQHNVDEHDMATVANAVARMQGASSVPAGGTSPRQRIVNMSYAWNLPDGAAYLANRNLFSNIVGEKQDILWIFAAGNYKANADDYFPGALSSRFDNVVTVGAVNSAGTWWCNASCAESFGSNFGDAVNIVAPGVNIQTTGPVNATIPVGDRPTSYTTKTGTSIAAPMVAGTASLVLSQATERLDWPLWKLKQCLVQTPSTTAASAPASPARDYYILDAEAAVVCDNATFNISDRNVDVVLAIDATGSMGEEILNVKMNITEIISGLRSRFPEGDDRLRIGVVSYSDYPVPPYGSPGFDYAYRVDAKLTDGDADAATAIANLLLKSGGDTPQDYGRVFWEIAQDALVAESNTPSCPSTTDHPPNELAFRGDSVKVIINFGDDVPHDTDLAGISPQAADPKYVLNSLAGLPGRDTGVDLGRQVAGCNDTIDFQDDALADMERAGVNLIQVYSGFNDDHPKYWEPWAKGTGGIAVRINPDGTLPAGLDLNGWILDLILYQLAV